MWPFSHFNTMFYLDANTAGQTLHLSLYEGRTYYTTAFTHYLIVLTREENSTTGLDLAQVATIVSETERDTTLTITTVPLTEPGQYRYDVYGQNSSSNIDPAHASVVGLVEQGTCIIRDTTTYYSVPPITIPDDYVSYS